MTKEENFKNKTKELSKKLNITIYEVYQKYMFERILERISVSKYKDNFILKGGILLSAIMGIENRTTRDMDTTIKGIDIDKESMIKVLNEILSINLNDGVKFELIDISNIREDDEYGGNKYTLYGKIGNTKVKLDIDISTGDIITPRELKYKYPLTFEDRTIIISTYNLSTIIAEKIETILSKGKSNSRMKDYYDLYFILSKLKNDINLNEVKDAVNNTFTKRNSLKVLNDYEVILNEILNSKYIADRWNIYSKKNLFAKNIDFKEIVILLMDFMNSLQYTVLV